MSKKSRKSSKASKVLKAAGAAGIVLGGAALDANVVFAAELEGELEAQQQEEAAQQALEAALDEDATANRRLEQEVEGTVIRAGALEKSNISIVTEMVNMIAIQRQYESNQKVITTFDESLDIAVNQLGRL